MQLLDAEAILLYFHLSGQKHIPLQWYLYSYEDYIKRYLPLFYIGLKKASQSTGTLSLQTTSIFMLVMKSDALYC